MFKELIQTKIQTALSTFLDANRKADIIENIFPEFCKFLAQHPQYKLGVESEVAYNHFTQQREVQFNALLHLKDTETLQDFYAILVTGYSLVVSTHIPKRPIAFFNVKHLLTAEDLNQRTAELQSEFELSEIKDLPAEVQFISLWNKKYTQ